MSVLFVRTIDTKFTINICKKNTLVSNFKPNVHKAIKQTIIGTKVVAAGMNRNIFGKQKSFENLRPKFSHNREYI